VSFALYAYVHIQSVVRFNIILYALWPPVAIVAIRQGKRNVVALTKKKHEPGRIDYS